MNLVYLVCLGDVGSVWLEMLHMCIVSLRQFGQYSGHIAVLTDQPPTVFGDDVLSHVEVVSVDSEAIVEPSHQAGDRDKYFLAKPKFHEFYYVRPFEHVMYLDLDILAARDVNPLFDCGQSLRYAREYHPMSAHWFSGCLTEEEIEEARWVRGVNAGTYCAPSDRFAEYMNVWLEQIHACPNGIAYDQPALNALILRKQIDARPFPDYSVAFPTQSSFPRQLRKQTRLLHYFGPKERALARMRQHYTDLMEGKPPRLHVGDSRENEIAGGGS